MADNGFGELVTPIKDAVTGGSSSSNIGLGSIGIGWLIMLIVGILIVATAGAIIWFLYIEKKKWNLVTRVHYENPTINGVSIGSGYFPTRRIRFKDGRVVYYYKKPIQGYTISPELLTWTRPGEHDVIVTQDKRLFSLVGIESIDTKRKKLNVDILHPDVEMDRQDLQHHIDSKSFDDPNERLKIIAKVATWIFVLTTVIILTIVGGKAYVDGKKVDVERDQINLQVSEKQLEVMNAVKAFISILEERGILTNNQQNINIGT